ncbi:hypothetical protein, partial [Acidithiobacillus thiooxidans]|uniref:hypothetical protein n=2 Tax=Acidithiobacillus thiooxidans TaxID=930 RepID=UPI001A7E077D
VKTIRPEDSGIFRGRMHACMGIQDTIRYEKSGKASHWAEECAADSTILKKVVIFTHLFSIATVAQDL